MDKTLSLSHILASIIGKEAVEKEIANLGVEDAKINKILQFIEIDGSTDEKLEKLKDLGIESQLFNTGVSELTEVIKQIRMYKVPEKNFKIDLTIARGLDYYTGTVYETFLDDYRKLGSVCSGGRYENLAEYYTNRKLPGVGISIGLTRFFYQMRKENILENTKKSISKVLIAPMSENEMDYASEVGRILRNANINTEIYLEDKKLKAKFKYADKLAIPYVAVIGEEEKQNNTVTVKNMETGEQENLELGKVVEKLQFTANFR